MPKVSLGINGEMLGFADAKRPRPLGRKAAVSHNGAAHASRLLQMDRFWDYTRTTYRHPPYARTTVRLIVPLARTDRYETTPAYLRQTGVVSRCWHTTRRVGMAERPTAGPERGACTPTPSCQSPTGQNTPLQVADIGPCAKRPRRRGAAETLGVIIGRQPSTGAGS